MHKVLKPLYPPIIAMYIYAKKFLTEKKKTLWGQFFFFLKKKKRD